MKKDVENILNALELLSTACGNIQDKDQCEYCPVKNLCLEGKYADTSLVEIADLVSRGRWTEFLEYADECVPSEALQEDIDYAEAADRGRDELDDE